MTRTRKVYIYRDSYLPPEGWFQGCFRCKTITAQYFLYKTFNKNQNLYEFYIYTCPDCSRLLKNNSLMTIHFNDCCEEYLNINYDYLFTG